MASTFSFDIVSKFDASEMDHAVDQSRRELSQRYDFKGTSASIDYSSEDKSGVTIEGDNDYQLQAIEDMFRKKLAKRNLSQKILDSSQDPEQAGMKFRWQVPFVSGLDQDKAKQVNKLIRDKLPKVKTQIQGEEIRVTSKSKDELQAVMTLLNESDLSFPIMFTNRR